MLNRYKFTFNVSVKHPIRFQILIQIEALKECTLPYGFRFETGFDIASFYNGNGMLVLLLFVGFKLWIQTKLIHLLRL